MMTSIFKRKLIIRYGELTLKKNNRVDFINKLRSNLEKCLSNFNLTYNFAYDYIEVFLNDDTDVKELEKILLLLPGISSFYVCYTCSIDTPLIEIAKFLSTLLTNVDSYKLEIKRINKSFPNSSDELKKIIPELIKSIMKASMPKIDVINPKSTINLIFYKNEIWIFNNKLKGMSGLPVGSSGKVISLISGGIDSPVASYLLMNRGLKVDFLTFISHSHSSKFVLDKVISLVKKITCNTLYSPGVCLYVCDFSALQNELVHISLEKYRITLMRRCFFKIAENLMISNKYDALATGESIGQVASQTIESIRTISDCLNKNTITLRPLIGLNKEIIIEYAKKIGTYDISIQPYSDICELFSPKHPITKPTIKTASKLESELDLLNDLILLTIKKNIKIFTDEDIRNYEIRNPSANLK